MNHVKTCETSNIHWNIPQSQHLKGENLCQILNSTLPGFFESLPSFISSTHFLLGVQKRYAYKLRCLRRPRDTTIDEIKKAYRKLQLKHHPDRTKDLPKDTREEYEVISKAVNVAYGILSNETTRRRYDETLPSMPRPASRPASRQPRPAPRPAPPNPCTRRPQDSVPKDKTLTGSALGWTWTLTFDGRFVPNSLPTTVLGNDSIIIKMGIKEPTPTGKPDVDLIVTQSADSWHIDKLQSSYVTHIPGTGTSREMELEITLARRPEKRSDASARLANQEIFQFAWNLTTISHCHPPPDLLAYGTCITFHRSPGEADSAIKDFPEHRHANRPAKVLWLDRFFTRFTQFATPSTSLKLRDMKEEGECIVECEGVKMLRRAAFGYVLR